MKKHYSRVGDSFKSFDLNAVYHRRASHAVDSNGNLLGLSLWNDDENQANGFYVVKPWSGPHYTRLEKLLLALPIGAKLNVVWRDRIVNKFGDRIWTGSPFVDTTKTVVKLVHRELTANGRKHVFHIEV